MEKKSVLIKNPPNGGFLFIFYLLLSSRHRCTTKLPYPRQYTLNAPEEFLVQKYWLPNQNGTPQQGPNSNRLLSTKVTISIFLVLASASPFLGIMCQKTHLNCSTSYKFFNKTVFF